MSSANMEEAGKRQYLKKRTVDNAAITQEQMKASEHAIQLNNRDIHGDLAFNHPNQAPRISIHYHNEFATITKSSKIFDSGPSLRTSGTSPPEVAGPISHRSVDAASPLSKIQESVQSHTATENSTRTSHFVETGLCEEENYGNRKSGLSSVSDDSISKEDALWVNHSTGRRNRSRWPLLGRNTLKRRNLWIAVLAILVIAGIATGVAISEEKRKHPATSALSSMSSFNPLTTSHGSNRKSTTSKGGSLSASTSQILSNTTSQPSGGVNDGASKSSNIKSPTSNIASTTANLLPSSTLAVPASTCTTNCEGSSTAPSPTAVFATSTRSSSTSKAAAKVSTASPSTTPKPTYSRQSCTIDAQCTVPGYACDYSASTCFICTYATLGEQCFGGEENCCDPWHCLPGTDSLKTCVSVTGG